MGKAVLPVLGKLAKVFMDDIVPAVKRAMEWLGDKLTPLFGTIKEVIGTVIDFVRTHWNTIVEIVPAPIERAAGILKAVFDVIKGVVMAAWEVISASLPSTVTS